jgi:fatty acid desaturase
MFFLGGEPFNWITGIKVIIMWTFLVGTGSFIYNFMAIAAGHHGPNIIHEGDEFESLDFGMFQLGATVDRKEANHNLVMVLISFGHHNFHHLFPSLDHTLLPQLNDTFMETCKDFDAEFQKFSFLDGVVAQYQQLGRTEIIKIQSEKTLQSVVINM